MRALILLVLALSVPLLMSRRATADLSTEPTVKTGEPTVKNPGDLDTGPPSGTVTLTPPTGTKPSGTGTGTGGAKPTASASASTSASTSTSATDEPGTSPSSSASGKPTGSYVRRKIELGVGDLAVALKVLDDWAPIAEESLPVIEPSEDSKVVLRKGFGVHAPKSKPPDVHEVIVVCGTAQGDYWGDNIRDAAFTQMVSGIEKEVVKYSDLKSIEPEPVRTTGDRLEQPFGAEADFALDGKTVPVASGSGKKKGQVARVHLLGLNFIGFHAGSKGAPTLVACSIACAQVTTAEGEVNACPAVIGSIEISGSFAPPPKRSWLAELLFTLKKDPTTMWLVIIGGVFLLVLIVVVIVVLARRKKKPAGAEHHEEHEEHEEHEGFDAGYQAGLAAARAQVAVEAGQAATVGVAGGADGLHASPPPPLGYIDPNTLEPHA